MEKLKDFDTWKEWKNRETPEWFKMELVQVDFQLVIYLLL